MNQNNERDRDKETAKLDQNLIYLITSISLSMKSFFPFIGGIETN